MWTNESFYFAFQLEVSSQKLSGSYYLGDFFLNVSNLTLFPLDEVYCTTKLHKFARHMKS